MAKTDAYIFIFFRVQNTVKSCTFFLEWANTCFLCYCKIHIFVLHVFAILYTQFLFSSMGDNKTRLVMFAGCSHLFTVEAS